MMTLNSTNRRLGPLRIAAFATITALLAGSAACAGASSGTKQTGTTTRVLTIAASSSPMNLDPALNGNGSPQMWFTRPAYEAFITRTPDGEATPGLATEWGYSDDRMKFVVTLREGVKFSDGTDLTAEAAANSINYWREHTSFTQYLDKVDTIEATGPLEVTFNLKTPDPLLPWVLDQNGQAASIIGPAGLENPEMLGTESVGAGPYMVSKSETIANSEYVYVKNPNYWNPDAQHYDKIIIKVMTDNNAALAALRADQVQVADIDANSVEAAKAAGLHVDQATAALVGIYLADLDGTIVPALKDVRVRQALNYALDRKGITEALYGSAATPTTQYVTEGVGGYVASLEDYYPHDPEKAIQLLTEAGYPDGFEFTLAVQPGALNQDMLSQAVVEAWAKIGVTANIKSYPSFADYAGDLMSLAVPATSFNYYYWGGQLVVIEGLFTNPALYNFFQYNDQPVNDLVAKERGYDLDSVDGIKAAEDVETYVVENAMSVPVAACDTILVSTDDVTGTEFSSVWPMPDMTNYRPAK